MTMTTGTSVTLRPGVEWTAKVEPITGEGVVRGGTLVIHGTPAALEELMGALIAAVALVHRERPPTHPFEGQWPAGGGV